MSLPALPFSVFAPPLPVATSSPAVPLNGFTKSAANTTSPTTVVVAPEANVSVNPAPSMYDTMTRTKVPTSAWVGVKFAAVAPAIAAQFTPSIEASHW